MYQMKADNSTFVTASLRGTVGSDVMWERAF